MAKANINTENPRICLVNPKLEGPYPPLGIGYVAAYLRKYGRYAYDIKIVDGNCSKDILNEILSFRPQIIGFTALSPQIKEAAELSFQIKDFDKNILQIIGGMHASARAQETLLKGSFDAAVLGEGEATFCELVDLFLSEKTAFHNYLEKIKGIAFCKKNMVIRNEQREEIVDLDAIPFPARELFDMEHYLSYNLLVRGLTGTRITTVMGSRGCPFSCTFCSSKIVFKRPRQFSANYMIQEIKDLVDHYNVKAVFFTDDTFTLNKQRVSDFCKLLIEEGLSKKIKWDVQGRADTINDDMLDLLRLMKESGCLQIDYGFESGSGRILDFLKKGQVTLEDNRRAIRITKEAGLQVMGTFMLGSPGETREDLEETRDFIMQNLDKIDYFQTFISTPYPGTELYEICLRKGIVPEDYFEQLEREKKTSCYSDTVSCDEVQRLLKYLNRVAASKIRGKDKIKWFISNLINRPHKIIDALKSYF